MNWDKSFWKGLLRESDGTPSSSRFLAAATVLAALGWITFIVVKTVAIPTLGPIGSFIVDVTLGLYGVNNLTALGKGAISAFGNKQDSTPQA